MDSLLNLVVNLKLDDAACRVGVETMEPGILVLDRTSWEWKRMSDAERRYLIGSGDGMTPSSGSP
jgi:hypothetical protein